ncbi:hypothetical protein DSCO28_64770 [Desulfosarcina ovata subsp. sediminis]|uniref:Uncharacterized protein n=1 Tax=Desulfosarcina ovata subsp. sediminis TaxID=885957 RepID=A0A5K8A0J4_9BACT|nr:hypothetical protein [Desulfosarcina ovata]BBO85911.1 hypothetical protein DSCO28_64770 [Desulfosarcina ovata subsp. sediminis]
MEYTTEEMEYYFNKMVGFFPDSVKCTLARRKSKPRTDDAGTLMGKARAILASNTHWTETLKMNITAMHQGLEADKKRGSDDRPQLKNCPLNVPDVISLQEWRCSHDHRTA